MTDAPPLAEQIELLRLFTADLPPSLRELVLERYRMGYVEYGDAWLTRDNLAEAQPEVADAIVYIFQAVISEQVRSKRTRRIRAALGTVWVYLSALCVGARKPEEAEA
jgi:hypothetical protein